MSEIIITHNDLDGITSAFFWKLAYGIKADNIFTINYSENRDSEIKNLILGISPPPMVMISDLSFGMGELEWARGIDKDYWVWFDHHQTSLEFSTFATDIFNAIYIKTDRCAAEIVWNCVMEDRPEVLDGMEEWVKIARDRDLWINSNRTIGMKLNMVVGKCAYQGALGNLFIVMEKGIDFVLKEYRDFWMNGMANYHKSRELALRMKRRYEVPFSTGCFPIVVSYVGSSISDVADAMYEDGNEVIALINRIPPNMVINLRTKRDDIDLSLLANSMFNGGGHKKAAGGKLTVDMLVDGYSGILNQIREGISKQLEESCVPF